MTLAKQIPDTLPWDIPEICGCDEAMYLRDVVSTLLGIDLDIIKFFSDNIDTVDKEIERIYNGMNYETYRSLANKDSAVQSGDNGMDTGGEG